MIVYSTDLPDEEKMRLELIEMYSNVSSINSRIFYSNKDMITLLRPLDKDKFNMPEYSELKNELYNLVGDISCMSGRINNILVEMLNTLIKESNEMSLLDNSYKFYEYNKN